MKSSSVLKTPLTEALSCKYPIVQTAMGWVSDAKLVIATTQAGGFGFLAGAVMETDELTAEIEKVIKSFVALFLQVFTCSFMSSC